jgi:hypothetical protein
MTDSPFQQSPEIKELIAAMLQVQAAGILVIERHKNTGTNSTYADEIDVRLALHPVLKEHDLALLQWPGPSPRDGIISLTNVLVHGSSQWMRQVMEITTPDMRNKDGRAIVNACQSYGMALTYAKRYALCSIFGLPSGKDDDAQALTQRMDGAPRKEPEPERTWQELYQSGAWRQGEHPSTGEPLGNLSKANLAPLLGQNIANGGVNPWLTAASMYLLEMALRRRKLSLREAAEKIQWRGTLDMDKMDAKIIQAFMASLLTSVTEPKQEEPGDG